MLYALDTLTLEQDLHLRTREKSFKVIAVTNASRRFYCHTGEKP
ncbi:unnamed protein product [Cyprideis torosa]|uniref:Uncharacterized protein n=1 Tax=Cyprideis torosa TaxID=163714 RepID=A0A7R8WPV6_9CRUS|nr:unnamed protein product [Cyprideis torosa]CAG0901973.1 unnamed protein product [Cyprideis torosa]